MDNLAKFWIFPVIISLVLFFIVKPVLAEIALPQTFVVSVVGDEVGENGFRQIYYIDKNNNKVFITSSNYTNANPVTDGENIAWMAQIEEGWRIFLYNLPSLQTLQLTFQGIHVNPKVDKGRVVWEGQDEEGVWQIFFYDKVKVSKITDGDMSLNPDIQGDFIVYGRKDESGWRACLYSVKERREIDVTTGEKAQKPQIKEGRIYINNGKEEFPLTIGDLFMLDFEPLSGNVSLDDILDELQATESAQIEIQSTLAPSLDYQVPSEDQE